MEPLNILHLSTNVEGFFFKVFAVGKSLLLSGVCQLPFVFFACCLTMLAGPILPSRNFKLTLFSYFQERCNLSFALEDAT